MKKKLISMGLCVMLLGTMCTSAFAGMDVSADLHNHTEELLEETNQDLDVSVRGLMCDCGGNMLNKKTYGSWDALYRTSCQQGRGFCTDEVRSRTVKDTWTCTRCGKKSSNYYEETKQVCLGKL